MKWLWMSLSLLCSCFAYAQLDIQLRPNPVVFGQEVKLIIKQTQSNRSKGLPDLTSLRKDFEILGTQESLSYQLINGKASQENIWTIILNPKHPGKITIPSFDFNGENTPNLELNVSPSQLVASPLGDGGKDDVYMSWEIFPEKPLLHEKVELTLKIYHTVPLLDARLSPPQVDNGLIFNLEDSQQQLEVINGKRYQIERSRFVIYPQKAGNLRIHSPILDALEYGMMPTPIHKTLPEKILHVQDIPAGEDIKNWLPASALSYEELKPLSKKIGLIEGDTVVRKIRLTAQGIPAQLMPDIQVGCGKNCQVYINPPKIENQMINGQLYGRKIFEITYLPAKAGSNQMTSIDIPWFNTKTKQQETLIIPAIAFEVFKSKVRQSSDNGKQSTHINGYSKTSLATLLLLSFLCGIACVYLLRNFSLEKLVNFLKDFFDKNAELKKACMQNDADKIRITFMSTFKKHYPSLNVIDLQDTLSFIEDSEMSLQIKSLIKFLYRSKSQDVFNGQLFWAAFSTYDWNKIKENTSNIKIEGLNP